jgi:hypothetical protein
MGRFFHKLKKNKTKQRPRNWLLFDCEANIKHSKDGTQTQTLRLGVGLYRRDSRRNNPAKETWFNFHTPYQFWNIALSLCELDRKLVIIGYNVGYDIRQVDGFHQLEKLGYIQDRLYTNNRVCLLEFSKGKHTITVLDAMNYFDDSLDSWGNMLGIKKYDVDFNNVTDKDLLKHCRIDVEILDALWNKWLSFIDDNDMGCFAPTKASQALTAFRHRFMHKEIFIHNNPIATTWEREGYYGGRVEPFFIGKVKVKPIYILDINSMYPSIMEKEAMPVKLISRRYTPSDYLFNKELNKYGLIARVLLNTDTPIYPCRREGDLLFPIGTFETTLCTPELLEAKKRKHVLKVIHYARYETEIIFDRYVKELYKLRMKYKSEGNKIFEQMVKYLLNCLYGKFGQRSETWDTIGEKVRDIDGTYRVLDGHTGEWIRKVVIASQSWKIYKPQESYHSFPAISAFVTSYARLLLWKYIEIAGKGNIYYCDTDSLFVNEIGKDNLSKYINPVQLGCLKVERVLHRLTVRGPKDYESNVSTKIKGITKTAKQLDDNTFEQSQWEGLRGAIANGRTDRVIITPMIKHLSRLYRKGYVSSDGSVTPLVLRDASAV